MCSEAGFTKPKLTSLDTAEWAWDQYQYETLYSDYGLYRIGTDKCVRIINYNYQGGYSPARSGLGIQALISKCDSLTNFIDGYSTIIPAMYSPKTDSSGNKSWTIYYPPGNFTINTYNMG